MQLQRRRRAARVGRGPRQLVRHAAGRGRESTSARARTSILKIDVQGAQKVKERVEDAILIFVVPPSLEALFRRLRSRATESAEELEIRQRNAAIELARAGRLRPRRDERGRPGGTDGGADRRDHLAGSTPPGRIGGSSLSLGRRCFGEGDAGLGAGRSLARRARSSRSRSTPRVAAAAGRTRTTCRSGCADVEPGEAVLVEYGRRQALARRARARRPTCRGSRRSRSSSGSGPTGRCCRR